MILSQRTRIRTICVVFFVGLGVFLSTSKNLLPPYYNTDIAVNILAKDKVFERSTILVKQKKIHLVHSGDKEKQPIVFIHGSPGNWKAWANYLVDPYLKKNSSMIAIDRLGFAGSDMGVHEASLQMQAQLIVGALEQYGVQAPPIIVGHSYGGPVALRMAVDYPQQIHSLILLAPSISPDLETHRWYNKLADLFFIRPFLPRDMHNSNQEILPLRRELSLLKPLLKIVEMKVSIIHGKNDYLVPSGNAEYGRRELSNAIVDVNLIPNRGHFIPWEEYDLVKDTVINHMGGYTRQ